MRSIKAPSVRRAFLLAMVLCGCEGALTGPRATPEDDPTAPRGATPSPFACDATTAAPEVNTVAAPRIDFEDTRTFTDIAAVTARIAESRRVDSCFARQYFRYSFRRGEDLTTDACALRAFDDAARSGSISDALAATAFLPGFKSRRLTP